MPDDPAPLSPGLYLVATPIGAARDITLRALDILASADVIAAEDTRSARHLMQIHGIAPGQRPVVAYHDHSSGGVRERLLAAIAEGKSVAYVSEAGTPLVADPGYRLVQDAIAAGLPLTVAPGPSAVIAALSLAGLPTDRFMFAGFPPAQGGTRGRFLEELAQVPATLVLYESPRRVNRLLGELAEHFGNERPAAICRELTKRFEEVRRGSLAELAASTADGPLKGECVVVIGRAERADRADAGEIEAALVQALARGSLKTAVAEVAAELGLPRRQVYQAALALGPGPDDAG